jgi:hypothetical protein
MFFLVCNGFRKAGPFADKSMAETVRLTYPNPKALVIKQDGNWKVNCDFADVGDKVEWTGGAGTIQGHVAYINRDLPTGDPRKNADYYMIRTEKGRGHYINSNMMKMLRPKNLSAPVQQELFA